MQDDPGDITGGLLIEETTNTDTDLSALPIFQPHMLRYVNRVIVPRFARQFGEDPEELEQEFWLKVLKSRHLLYHIDYPKSWAWVTMRHLCLNRKRDRRLEKECTVAIESAEALSTMADGPEEVVDHKERRTRLRDMIMCIIEGLPPQEAHVVHLFLIGKSAQQVVKETQLSMATVYRIRDKAKAILKHIVREYGIDIQLEDQRSLTDYLEHMVAMSLLEQRSHLR
jgi:RNA polymerase sigma factor (sigma-70 family)